MPPKRPAKVTPGSPQVSKKRSGTGASQELKAQQAACSSPSQKAGLVSKTAKVAAVKRQRRSSNVENSSIDAATLINEAQACTVPQKLSSPGQEIVSSAEQNADSSSQGPEAGEPLAKKQRQTLGKVSKAGAASPKQAVLENAMGGHPAEPARDMGNPAVYVPAAEPTNTQDCLKVFFWQCVMTTHQRTW